MGHTVQYVGVFYYDIRLPDTLIQIAVGIVVPERRVVRNLRVNDGCPRAQGPIG